MEVKTRIENTPARRFTLAHELGHAVLDREMGGHSNELPVEEQEEYAEAFAAELLLPDSLAQSLRASFVQAPDVRVALDLAKSVRVPPKVLLVRASRENWLEGLDVVWLEIRTAPNKVTGRDSRPRIFYCVRDRDRWYVPTNRSIRGVFGRDDWLLGARRQLAIKAPMEIDRLHGSPVKFIRESVPAAAVAFRMRRPGPAFGPEVLARVELHPEGRDG
ncbi:MAG TPA: ImmA/IrrE family metallo-endopeptidase [Solirubrobacterales bacterium]|nr:ImmA/IrrE family metallo-endopeptidase [Solirubrobacterales bacterium]